MYAIRDNFKRGRLAYVFSLTTLGALIICFLSTLYQFDVVNRYTNGKAEPEDITSAETIGGIITLGYLAIGFVGFVFFLLWFRRAYFNLNQISPDYASYGEGWAVGGWFVPFLNFFYPYKIMREIKAGSESALRDRQIEKGSNFMVAAWWTCYLTSIAVGQISTWVRFRAVDFEDVKRSLAIGLLSQLINIVCLGLAAALIKNISTTEEQLHQLNIPEDSIFYIPAEQETLPKY